MTKVVHVAVGVIKREQQVFLTKRAQDVHQGGKWEFPGGKVEPGESVFEALHRELQEEIGIDTLSCLPLVDINHDYGDKQVRLEVFVIDNFASEPKAQEDQEEGWFSIGELHDVDFPEANRVIVDKLQDQYK